MNQMNSQHAFCKAANRKVFVRTSSDPGERRGVVERVSEPAEGAGAARGVGEPVPREEPRGEDEGADADGRRRPQQGAEAHPHRVTGSDPGLTPPAPVSARARSTVLSSCWQKWRGRCLGVRGGHLKERRDQIASIFHPRRNYQPCSQRNDIQKTETTREEEKVQLKKGCDHLRRILFWI